MDIEILGLGHVKSDLTEESIRQVLHEEGVYAQVENVTGWENIAGYGIFLTPSVLVDGEVKCVGRIPTRSEIRAWIAQAANQDSRGPASFPGLRQSRIANFNQRGPVKDNRNRQFAVKRTGARHPSDHPVSSGHTPAG